MRLEIQLVLLSLLSGIIHLDTMSVGQFMISRPIIVGPLMGYLLNSPELGLTIGVIIELLYISVIPVGLKIPPDSTLVTIFSLFSARITGCVAISIFLATLFALLFKWIDIKQRVLHNTLLAWVDAAKPEVVERRVGMLVFYGIILTYIRTVTFYLIFFPILYLISSYLCSFINQSGFKAQMHNIIYLLPAVGVGIGIAHFVEK